MAPPPQPLPEDLVPDILLRLPPDDPAGLVRVSAVCKAWRRIITDPAFHGDYRALHPRAHVLGFLHRPRNELLPRFVSTTSFRPAAADHCLHPLDCRHGRAVFYDYGTPDSRGVIGSYVVWDPVTGDRHEFPDVPDVLTHPTVVCAADGGCDNHRGCRGGPFVLVFVGVENLPASHYFDAHACFYESDTGKLSLHLNIHLDHGGYSLDESRPAALVGDSLYYICWPGILRYRYGLLRRLGGIMGMISEGIGEGDILSMMELPRGEHLGIGENTDMVVMEAEGGGLGLAYLCPMTRTMLYLLAMETEGAIGDDAANRWVQRRVIDLKMLLPLGNDPEILPCLSGIAQDTNVIFVSTEDGVFSVDHGGSSLQVRKVCETGVVVRWMYPFVSFYTESLMLKLASGKLPELVGNQ